MNWRVLVSMSVLTLSCATPSPEREELASKAPPSGRGAESARSVAGEVTPEGGGALAEDPILNGEVWWYDASVEECQKWHFVRFDGYVALERRSIEVGDGWSREVRVFYNIGDQTELDPRRHIYAAGYDYAWIQEPGPDAASSPGQRGAIGCVATFEVVESTDELIRWSESGCVRGPEVWYRSKQRCEDDAR